MAIELRDYQTECVQKVLDAYKQNRHGHEYLVLPTGAGKTVIAAEIIRTLARVYGINTLFIAHRDELLSQAADKYWAVKPDAVIGKVGAGIHQYGGEVTVASIATISRPEHIKKLKAIGYGLIIVDEFHHSAAHGYQAVLDALPDAFVLGLTATPDRLDKKDISKGKKPLYQATIVDMIKNGYLCNVKAIAVKTDTTLEDIKTTAGDYNEHELDLAVNTPERNRRVVEAYQEHTQGKRAVAFCVTVAHAQALAYAFNEHGINAALISGDTSIEERKRIYKAFRDGSIRVLCNVMVLTEGWDEPLCEVAIMARPTQSRGLYCQCVGRILRLAPGKRIAIILDLTDNCQRLRLTPQNFRQAVHQQALNDETLLDALAREENEKAERIASEKRALIRKLNERRDKDQHIDLFALPEWEERTNGMFVLTVGLQNHRIAIVPRESSGFMQLYDVFARLAPDFRGQKWAEMQTLDGALQVAEKKARMLLQEPSNVKFVDRTAPWRDKPIDPSGKQVKYLKWKHIPFTMEMTRGEAQDIIDADREKTEAKKQAKLERQKARMGA